MLWVWCGCGVYNVAAERSDYIKCYLRRAAMLMWSGEERFGGIKCYLRGAAMLVWSGEERFGVEWY